jgi:hypothetical protein
MVNNKMKISGFCVTCYAFSFVILDLHICHIKGVHMRYEQYYVNIAPEQIDKVNPKGVE